MKIYKNYRHTKQVLVNVVCDKCHKVIDVGNDDFEYQEMLSIDFVGGYTSVFGDGNQVACDLCQQCLYKLIKDFCRYI